MFTEYDEDNNPIKSETLDVLEWDIWGNSQDAYNSMNDFYIRDIIFNYQRYFRPFKVVYAGSEETQALSDGNYRIRRDFELNFTPDNELRTDFYEPNVNSGWWNQVEIKEDDTNNICEAGDRLIYFEVCGDVRPFGSASANILYDHHANIYVYNMDKKVVYWNHIASLVETVPLPKQWLKMRSFIRTEKIYL